MKALRKMVGIALAAIPMTAGITAGVQRRTSTGLLRIKGAIVCTGCDLNEVRKTQPAQRRLYQLTHAQGQVVMDIRMVNNFPGWLSSFWPSEIRVRAREDLFQQLAAEENLFKEVEIIGLFSATRALDIFDVKFVQL